MGYRSDVSYIVAFHHTDKPEVAHADFIAFQEWVKHHKIDTPEDYSAASGISPVQFSYADAERSCSHFKFYPQEGILLMGWESVKWYPNYPEVIWHTQLLDKCLEFSTGAFRFVRIGEEYNDIDVMEQGDNEAKGYSLYEWVDVSRSILFSPPDETLNKEVA